MKKLLGILVISLLWCNVTQAATDIFEVGPFDRAQSRLSELFFKKLINLNVLRNYSEKQLQDRGGWTSPRLRFFGKVYPAKDKFDLEIPERTDKLV